MERRLSLTEFHVLSDDPAVERELIRGSITERPRLRNRRCAAISAALNLMVCGWADRAGAGTTFSLPRIDFPALRTSLVPAVAYFDRASMDRQPEDDVFLTGPPTLAVEIMSPSDRFERLWAKVDDYLAAGTPWVWVIDPHFRTVLVLRPDHPPALSTGEAELKCEPEMPGFATPAGRIFPR